MRDRIQPTHQMMPNHRSFFRTGSIYSLFLLATMAATTPLLADTTTYFSRSQFEAALPGQPLFVDNFNHIRDQTKTGPTPVSLLDGAASITSTTEFTRPDFDVLFNLFDAEPHSADYKPFGIDCQDVKGTIYIADISSDVGAEVTLGFPSRTGSAHAVGFDYTGVNGQNNGDPRLPSYRVTTEDGGTLSEVFPLEVETGFLGFHNPDSPIVSIEFFDARPPDPPDEEISIEFFAIDNVTVSLPDRDGDGMSDLFEDRYGLDANNDDSAGDKDGDGLSNWDEFMGATNPDEVDTDGDGLTDNVETMGGSFESLQDTGTNPWTPDSDEDNLPDGEEIAGGTDPNSPDTDGDGHWDDFEISLGSDPTSETCLPLGIGSNLVAYYNMDEGLLDQIGRHPLARLWGGNFTGTGMFGRAAAFPYGTCPMQDPAPMADLALILQSASDFDFSSSGVTISMWVKVSCSVSHDAMLISKGEGSWRLYIPANTDRLAFSVGDSTVFANPAGPQITDDEWHHVVAIVEAGVGTRLFVDGMPAGNDANSTFEWGSDSVGIGGNPSTHSDLFSGLIDDVAIWSHALPKSYIEALWNDGNGATVAELFSPIAELKITHFQLNPMAGTVDLRWASDPCKLYTVERSLDLKFWFGLEDGVEGQEGETGFSDRDLPPNAERIYYRVRETF